MCANLRQLRRLNLQIRFAASRNKRDEKPNCRLYSPESRCCSEPTLWSRNSERPPVPALRPPKARHVAYERNFTVPRALQHLMTATKVQGWPPKHGDFARIEWPNSEIEEDEAIVGPLRLLSEKSSPSEDEVQIAIDRAQATLLNEFGRVCAEIRRHYPDGLPRFMALPSFTTRALAAE